MQIVVDFLQSLQFLRGTTGAIAISKESLPPQFYIEKDRAHALFGKELPDSLPTNKQLEWMVAHDIRYVIESTAAPLFSVTEEHPERFTPLHTSYSRAGSFEATVYEFHE